MNWRTYCAARTAAPLRSHWKRSGKITPENIARLYGLKVEDITDFASYDPGLGFKITYLRKTASGTVGDRDVYGAQQHAPLMNIEIPDEL